MHSRDNGWKRIKSKMAAIASHGKRLGPWSGQHSSWVHGPDTRFCLGGHEWRTGEREARVNCLWGRDIFWTKSSEKPLSGGNNRYSPCVKLEETGGLVKDLPDWVPPQAIPIQESAWMIHQELQQDCKPGLVRLAWDNQVVPDVTAGHLVQDCKDERSGRIC
jgi:hypothetical protein